MIMMMMMMLFIIMVGWSEEMATAATERAIYVIFISHWLFSLKTFKNEKLFTFLSFLNYCVRAFGYMYDYCV